jgi:hypothetical protein
MTTRELPESLKGQSSRENKEWYKEMMSKFKKLNDEYNKRAEGEFSKDSVSIKDDVLNFDEDNVFNMITRAKQDIKLINENNNLLNKRLKEYDECHKNCRTLIERIEKVSDTYYKLSTESQLFDGVNKLPIKQHLVDLEFTSNIIAFQNDINLKIDELNQEIKNNNKKISDFRKLVLKCIHDTEGKKEYEKNICSVCVTRKINTCLNPCGHTFCVVCADKMNNKCGMCRATFISKIKMFIADDDEIEESEYETNNNEDGVVGFDGFDFQPYVSMPIPNVVSYISH